MLQLAFILFYLGASDELMTILTQATVRDVKYLKETQDPIWNGLLKQCPGKIDLECNKFEKLFHHFSSCRPRDQICLDFHQSYERGFSKAFIDVLLKEKKINKNNIKQKFPLLYRSAMTNSPPNQALIDFNDYKSTPQEKTIKRKEFSRYIQNEMDTQNQLVGLELECWSVKMELDYTDNLDNNIIAACNYGKFDTYGLPIMCTKERMGLAKDGYKFNVFDVVFESRYLNNVDPYIEIRSAPMSVESLDWRWNIGNVKQIMSVIPQTVKEHKTILLVDWIKILNDKMTEDFGLTWHPVISDWSNQNEWDFDLAPELKKVKKQDLSQNLFYFDKNLLDHHCIVQSNVDIPLGQFYTASNLINSMAINKEINNRAIYAAAWYTTKALITTQLIDQENLESFDSRDYAAGIVTLALYQAIVRSDFSVSKKQVNKNMIQQLLKVPVSDLPRLKGLKLQEKNLIYKMFKDFMNWNYEQFMLVSAQALEQAYGKNRDFMMLLFVEVQNLIFNWFLTDYFVQRYPEDVVSDQGLLIHFGSSVVWEESEDTTLPLEVGSPIPPRTIISHNKKEISVVVETRNSHAPFNYFIFWNREPYDINSMHR